MRILIYTFIFCLSVNALSAQISVTMQHNDLKRTGWMNQEKILNKSNVKVNSFGKIFTRTVDDQIYAQPLIVSNIKIKNVKHNVVYVATVNNSVYAFDADNAAYSTPLWHVNITAANARAIRNTDMTGACGGRYKDFSGQMGIVGTPVIDTATNTLYVVARSVSTDITKTFSQYLHAIDIRTGAEKPNSPVFITATVNGTGDGSVNGKITFDQQHQNQRPGLLLLNNVVYLAWASHCDWSPYHGWMIGYDATTLQQKYVYNTTPYGGLAGIWMSGQAPAVDDNGFIYLTTGNGTVGSKSNANDPINRGESIIKLSTQDSLHPVDFFTPHNYKHLDLLDLDYGCDGVLLLPRTHLSLSGSKQSQLYLVNTSKMGRVSANDSGALQIIDINAEFNGDRHVHGSPVYYLAWNKKEFIYAWAEDGLLKQIPFNRAQSIFDTAKTITGITTLPLGMPGAMLAVSSNGIKKNTGILWAVHPSSGDANHDVVPGILQAFDADNVQHELWNSNQNPDRDSLGRLAKFVCPTIANGKVYIATFSNQLDVYGLLPNTAIAFSGDVNNSRVSVFSRHDLNIYPNPAKNKVNITYNSKSAQQALIMLINDKGNLQFKQSINLNAGANDVQIQFPFALTSGVYVLQITTADAQVQANKLVIEK